MLELDGVNTYYGQIQILQGISLQVDEGELVCLLGGNASGKSTTLKTILGIVKPRSGRVLFRGEDVTGVRRASASAAAWRSSRRTGASSRR